LQPNPGRALPHPLFDALRAPGAVPAHAGPSGALGLARRPCPSRPSHGGFQLCPIRHRRPPWRFAPISLGAPAATLRVGHKPHQPPAEQLARPVLAAEGRGAPLRPPLAPPLRAAKGAPPSALSPSPPGELQGRGQLRSPKVTEDHGGLAPIPPLACCPSRAGGHRSPGGVHSRRVQGRRAARTALTGCSCDGG
jgi:hypothetical protein